MDPILMVFVVIPALLLCVALFGWMWVTWQSEREFDRRQAQREQGALAPRRSQPRRERRRASEASGSSAPDQFRGATHMIDADPIPAVPHVYSSPSLHGAGGEFAGGGTSGSWESPSCGGDSYSSASSDSSSSCSSPSGSD